MATAVEFRSKLIASQTGAPDIGQTGFSTSDSYAQEFEDGTGVAQCDTFFSDTRTLSASATENLDLSGSLGAPLGGSAVFADVKVLRVRAAAGNTNNVVIGGAGSNTWVGPFANATDKISIPPGGCFEVVHPGAGWTVTASTGDILLVANSGSGTSVSYDIEIAGGSA